MSYVEANREWLEPYIRQLADALGLPHWRIILKDDPPNDGCVASTRISATYQWVHMMLEDPLEHDTSGDDPASILRDTIVHELVHVHLHDWDQTVRSLEDHVNPATWDLMEQMMYRALERAVDAIAVAWAERLPLPEIPEREGEAA